MTDELVRIIREGLRRYEKYNVYRATLGDGQGNVKVAGEPFKAWARIQYLNGIEKRQIRIQKIRPINNAPVLVKQGYDDEWEAVEGDPAQLNYWTGVGSPNVPEHAVSHQRWGNDPLLLQSLMFNPLLITPTNPVGTSVYVYPLFYRHDGTYKYYAGGTYGVATSGNLPGTAGHQQVSIVGLDATNNTPAIYNGASEFVPPFFGQSVPFTAAQVATMANNATFGSDFIPGIAVRLYEGQTEVNLYDIFQDARQWLTTESSSAGGSSFTDQTAAVYVSKIGNDSDDGLTPDRPKLTIGAAITAASALLTAGADTVRIEVQDGGQYSESLTIPSNVTLDAPAATLIGELDLEDDTVTILDRHYASANSDIMVDRSSGGGVAYYYVNLSDGRGAGGSLTDVLNVRNVSNGSVLHVHAQVLVVCEDGRGVSDTAGGFGHTHLYAGDIYLGGDSAVGVAAYGSGSKLIGYVDHFLEIGSPATTTALGVQNANADVIMTVSEIIADTAYNVVSGDLYLQCPKVTGTQTGTPTYITPGVQSQTANTVYAGPDGSPGLPTFRALVADDIPALDIYALLAGRTGGQTLYGGDTSGDDLTLHSNTSKDGLIQFGDNSAFDQAADTLGLGTTSPSTPLTVLREAGDAAAEFNKYGTGSSYFRAFSARGTVASPSATLNNDLLFAFIGYGYGATGPASTINTVLGMYADETWDDSNQGSRIDIFTTPTGATTTSQALSIKGDNRLQIFGDLDHDGSNIGFFGTTPIAKITTGVSEASFTANSGTAVNDNSTFGGYTLQQIVQALKNYGLLT